MERFGVAAAPAAKEQVFTIGETIRISVLSDRILRLERQAQGDFEDRPTQKIMCRDFAHPVYEKEIRRGEKEGESFCTVKTERTEFLIDLKSLRVSVKQAMGNQKGRATIDCEDSQKVTPIGGTFRTLDNAMGDRVLFGANRGKIVLKDSVFSREGVAEIDDSASYLLNEDGTLSGREADAADRYILAFGKDFLGGLKEFYQLTGFTPLLPKYALGNWWSRYYPYRQQEYLDLMDQFARKGIPLTVATIDMDWHLVKNVPKDVEAGVKWLGRGWTGYTFEKELFPDYRQFFRDLRERGLAVTMNLHPHDGIRYYEEQYPAMAKANGIDPDTKEPVAFDFTDLTFVKSYFDLVLHPYEDEGVDFWWIDWQQGTKSAKAGLDPLWLLNHYHTLDAGRDNRTPLILSRYSGTGAHRYPLGFSGDTIVSWSSLKYQPYFTLAASNVGYTWWSHDIGGHMASKGNPELYTRWLQYGVFSPINRLHSTRDKWSKEPWLYGERAERIVTEFLRLRHRLLPYLYTANVLTAREGIPLVMPMYYIDDCREAYECKNQYYFGRDMIVAPVLDKMDKSGESKVTCWLPEGTWTDFFTGEQWEGGKTHTISCPLERIPVFVRAGAVIPLLAEDQGNRQEFTSLEVLIYAGNGNYRMEDETGCVDFSVETADGKCNVTVTVSEDAAVEKMTLRLIGGQPGALCAEGKKISVQLNSQGE